MVQIAVSNSSHKKQIHAHFQNIMNCSETVSELKKDC